MRPFIRSWQLDALKSINHGNYHETDYSPFMSLSKFLSFSNIEGMKPSMILESASNSCIGRKAGNRSSNSSTPLPPSLWPSISPTSTITLYLIANPKAIIELLVSTVTCEIPSSSITETSRWKSGGLNDTDGVLDRRNDSKIQEKAFRSTAPFGSANCCIASSTLSVSVFCNPGKVFTAFSTFGRESKMDCSLSGVVATISFISSSMATFASDSGFGITTIFVKESLVGSKPLSSTTPLSVSSASALCSATILASESGGRTAVPKSNPPANCTQVKASTDFGRSVSTGEITTGIQYCVLPSWQPLPLLPVPLSATSMHTNPRCESIENPAMPGWSSIPPL
mmetsp:Transcript_5155/g.15006  ORF Transcript_5155/g.15006 Transcript_5155/m.15006 type:complete len:340 (+) Transcript_5155:314-1333(+)